MANPSTKRIASAAMAASAANVYNNASALIFDVVKHVHFINTSGSTQTVFLFVSQTTGVETAGKELFSGLPIAANSTYDYYCNLKLLSTDFLVGHASAVTVSILVESEQYAV